VVADKDAATDHGEKNVGAQAAMDELGHALGVLLE
jgi:hypothetical protein